MKEETIGEIGEKALLQRLRRHVSQGGRVVRSFSEDCAVVDAGGGLRQLITIDVLVEGEHFRRNWMPPFYLGRKAVNVNVSDISAMGGRARFFLISLGLPPDTPSAFVEDMYRGIESAAASAGLILAGGNVSESPSLFLDIVMVGDVEADRLLLRQGARAGDIIFVTGQLGASAAGLALLESGMTLETASQEWMLEAMLTHLDPPQFQETAVWLGECGCVTAMMDLSDGLASDLPEICHESRVGARIRAEQIPIASAARKLQGRDPLDLALKGGEDYHLLFTVSGERLDEFKRKAGEFGAEFIEIGQIVREEEGISLRDASGEKPLHPGFQHFHKES